jgi:hypothetical protein
MHTVGPRHCVPDVNAIACCGRVLRGSLLLHLVEYPDAAKSFREAERLDPVCHALGEAMSHSHGIWNEVDEEPARRA